MQVFKKVLQSTILANEVEFLISFDASQPDTTAKESVSREDFQELVEYRNW